MEIEFEDSVIVDDGEVALVVVVELDGGDFIFSNSKLYAAEAPLLKQADISWPDVENQNQWCKYTLFMSLFCFMKLREMKLKKKSYLYKTPKPSVEKNPLYI